MNITSHHILWQVNVENGKIPGSKVHKVLSESFIIVHNVQIQPENEIRLNFTIKKCLDSK